MDSEHAKSADLLLRCYRAMRRRPYEDGETMRDVSEAIEHRLNQLFGPDWDRKSGPLDASLPCPTTLRGILCNEGPSEGSSDE